MNAVSDAGAPRRIKVLHIITGLGTGGAERMLVALLEATDRSRFQPEVVSLMGADALGATVRTLGVPLHTLGMRRGLPSPWALPRLRRLVRQCAPDLVHGWMYHGALAALLAARDRPVVVGIHHALHRLEDEKAGTRLVIGALRRVSAGAARLVYCSAVSRQQHERYGYRSANALVIPNGFDCARFRPDAEARARLRKALGFGPEHFLVGNVGRYHPLKDQANFLRAAALLRRTVPRARFVMAGAGIDWTNSALRTEAERLGLTSSLRLLGERQDVPQLLNALDVYVSSSRSEAFPLALGEAMACAVPCVATDVGDSADMVGDTGAVVPPSDAAALATAAARIAGLDEAERRRLGEAARRRVLSRYSLETVTAAYQALYRQLVEMRATERSVGTITGKG